MACSWQSEHSVQGWQEERVLSSDKQGHKILLVCPSDRASHLKRV